MRQLSEFVFTASACALQSRPSSSLAAGLLRIQVKHHPCIRGDISKVQPFLNPLLLYTFPSLNIIIALCAIFRATGGSQQREGSSRACRPPLGNITGRASNQSKSGPCNARTKCEHQKVQGRSFPGFVHGVKDQARMGGTSSSKPARLSSTRHRRYTDTPQTSAEHRRCR